MQERLSGAEVPGMSATCTRGRHPFLAGSVQWAEFAIQQEQMKMKMMLPLSSWNTWEREKKVNFK